MMLPITSIELKYEEDVLFIMKISKKYTQLAGLTSQQATKFVTAQSELCRNAFQYASGARVNLFISTHSHHQYFMAKITDQGSGIPHLDKVMQGQYHSGTGMGLGLQGSRKLVDLFEIESSTSGTRVTIGCQITSRPDKITRETIADWEKMIEVEQNVSPLQELKKQNQRLVEAYEIISKKEEKLAEANHQLQMLIGRLEQKNEELRDFAHVVSHDLKSPLNVIFMAAEMVDSFYKKTMGEDALEMFTMIVGAAKKMKRLINDMLDYATSSVHEDMRQSVSLNELVQETLSMIAIPENVHVETADLHQVYYDRVALQQVLQNLLTNAIKYSDKPHTHIEIATEDQEKFIVLKVSDNGPGIHEEDFQNVFKLFQTLKQKSRMESGTGVGLPLVKRIADRNNGNVWIESELDQGSTFYFSIPKTQQ